MSGVMHIGTVSGHVILVDNEDGPMLSGYTWYVNHCGGGKLYAQARGDGKKVSMHRLLMNAPPGLVVHHRNGNGLDNRRENLEITSQRQNMRYRFGKEPEPESAAECAKPIRPHGKRAQAEIGRLRADIERLRDVIREMGEIADLCTYPDLKEICSTCRCSKRANGTVIR